MMRRLWFPQMLIALAWGVSAGAQTASLAQTALTNKDVVTLAKAGFNEEFIMDTISMSRTHFDVTVNGLAELAKEGLTERLIRFMMTAGAGVAPVQSAASGTAQEALMVSPAMNENPAPRGQVVVVKPSAVRQALSSQTPYYEWTSVFWGLWKKKVGVGAMPRVEQVVAPSLGGFYQQVRVPVTNPARPRSGNAYEQVATRYVVLQ